MAAGNDKAMVIHRLLEGVRAEGVGSPFARQLADLLHGDPDACELYLDMVDLSAQLECELVDGPSAPLPAAAGDHIPHLPTPTAEMPKAEVPSFFPALWDSLPAGDYLRSHWVSFWLLFVVGCCIFWGTFYGLVWSSMKPDLHVAKQAQPAAEQPAAEQAQPVAKLCQVDRAVWAGGFEGVPEQGKYYDPGDTIELQSGLAAISFNDGAEVVLEGPCKITFQGTGAARLERGKLAAKVEEETAQGFIIDTPFATVTDLGTEFGVAVDEEAADVEVYQGAVVMAVTDSGGRKRTVRITAGGTVRADRHGKLTNSADGAARLAIVREIRRSAPERKPAATRGAISIWNPSFENPDQEDLQRLSDGSAYIAGWNVREDVGRGGVDIYLAGPSYSNAASPAPTDGRQFVVMSGYGAEGGQAASGAVYQLGVVPAPLAPNTTYTLTFDVGNRDTSTSGDATTTIEAFFTLDHEDAAATHTANAVGTRFSMTLGDIPKGAMLTDRTATFTTGSTDLNHSLNICLKQISTDPNSTNWAQSRWDNIRLQAHSASASEGMTP